MNYPPQPPGPNWPPQQPQPNWPPQQPRQPAEGIAITTQFMPLSFMLALFKPKILVDGYETPQATWGRNVVPVRPGQHRVHVHVPYLLPSQIGPADAIVEVYPGRLAELEYKAPVWGFSPGSLGAAPQSYNGVAITVAILGVLVALPILFMILLVLLAAI